MGDQAKIILRIEEIQKTIERLILRINDRFPQSGLSSVCQALHEISLETDKTVRWISRPSYFLRLFVYTVICLLGLLLAASIQQLNLNLHEINMVDFIQLTEAGLNEIVLIGAGILFLMTWENRRKRKRIINAVNRLRSIAHIVDAHQLTKDPAGISKINMPTPHSPERALTDYQLSRYLDYCSEMLSLVSKIGYLYVQNYDDSIANNAVNELDNLTNGLSRKIWQKIMIIRFDPNFNRQ
ncbi:MAG: hypothetical protein JXR73_09530 [Candidatus Omnitrophica bacterium]|nr:hypothetical protein [Candidatus Omnitrophota bacterium]